MMKLDPKKWELPRKDTYKLHRMREAVAALQHPEKNRKTILIAGTNGKGSVAVLLTHLFRELGIKVGTYTSPHMLEPNERISINGKSISNFALRALEKKYSKILEPLTFFERWTALGFLAFRDERVDVQILEVGMGGRLDATNVSDPDLSVITAIGYDHQEVLGETLTKIALEKAGVMRPRRPVVLSKQIAEAKKSLLKRACDLESEVILAEQFSIDPALEKWILRERGLHQIENTKTAIASFLRACELWDFPSLSRAQVSRAVKRPLLVGRIQKVKTNPLWLVDGAHNEDAIKTLVAYLSKRYPGFKKRFLIIFGAMKDKEAGLFARKLSPWASEYLLPSFYPEREWSPKDLHEFFPKAETCRSVQEAIQRAKERKKPTLVVGSLYLAGAVLKALKVSAK